MANNQQYIYDEVATRNYIKRELDKLDKEREAKLNEYNSTINELSTYNSSITNMSSNYKQAYKIVLDAGDINGLPLTDTEKLLEASSNIDELVRNGALDFFRGEGKLTNLDYYMVLDNNKWRTMTTNDVSSLR